MRVYIVTNREDGDTHAGYQYFTNKKIALRHQLLENEESGCEDEINEVEIKLNKKDVLSFLNIYCSYPNNG